MNPRWTFYHTRTQTYCHPEHFVGLKANVAEALVSHLFAQMLEHLHAVQADVMNIFDSGVPDLVLHVKLRENVQDASPGQYNFKEKGQQTLTKRIRTHLGSVCHS